MAEGFLGDEVVRKDLRTGLLISGLEIVPDGFYEIGEKVRDEENGIGGVCSCCIL